MKKRIYGLIFVCLVAVSQQTKAFIEMGALAYTMGSAGLSFVQSSVMSAMMVALARKAGEYGEQTKMVMDGIALLSAARNREVDTAKKVALTQKIAAEQEKLKVKQTLMQRVAGIIHPVLGLGMMAADTYSGVSAFAGIFGIGLPSAGGLFFNYLMGGGGS